MKYGKVLFLIIIILIGCYAASSANSYGNEANYIAKNIVEISRIDSFLFNDNYRLSEKKFVTRSLIKYTREEAIILLKKILNDSIPELKSTAVMPLINAGEFDFAFNKLKELIRQNKVDIIDIFYVPNVVADFETKKRLIYTKYRDKFMPYFMELCEDDSVSYEIKYYAAYTLYYLDDEDILRQICNAILAEVPDPEISQKDHSKFTKKERKNWQLRYHVQHSLKSLNDESNK